MLGGSGPERHRFKRSRKRRLSFLQTNDLPSPTSQAFQCYMEGSSQGPPAYLMAQAGVAEMLLPTITGQRHLPIL
jgi:hypothetical protein